MEMVELSPQDRDRLDTLIGLMNKIAGGEEIIVSCNEAARLLGKSPTTISNMIREKRLKKVKIGYSTGIRLSEIESYMKDRREAREP